MKPNPRGKRERSRPLRLACADFAFPLLPHDRVLDLIASRAAPIRTTL